MASPEEISEKVNNAIDGMFSDFLNARRQENWMNSDIARHLAAGNPIAFTLSGEKDGIKFSDTMVVDPNTLSTEELTDRLNSVYEGIRSEERLEINGASYPEGRLSMLRDSNYSSRTYGDDITLPSFEFPELPELPSAKEFGRDVKAAGLAIAELPGTLITGTIQAGIDGANLAATGVKAAYEGAADTIGQIPPGNPSKALERFGEGGVER